MKFILVAIAALTLASAAKSQGELPPIAANRMAFYIPEKSLSAYSLKEAQHDEWMMVYDNFEKDAAVQRVVDIRWEAKTKEEAASWFDANTKLLGEGGDDITNEVKKPAMVDSWTIYTPSKESKDLFKSMGVEQNQYIFAFTVDKYVAKIFIATGAKQTVMDAWQLGWEGLTALLNASGKTKQIKTE
jgi:hypothetical protein